MKKALIISTVIFVAVVLYAHLNRTKTVQIPATVVIKGCQETSLFTKWFSCDCRYQYKLWVVVDEYGYKHAVYSDSLYQINDTLRLGIY
jgi:hypothetical protein